MFDIYNVVIFPKEGQPRPTMINTRSEVVLQEAQTKIRACGIPHALILVIYGVKAHRSTLRTYAYINLDLQDVKALVSLLRICSNNLNQYAKRANETGSIYEADINDLQVRLEEIWTDMKEVLVRLSSIQ